MTPFYDVISAQPSVDSRQIPWNQFRLAMGFGATPHYSMRKIAPRHFFETGQGAGIGRDVTESIIEELLGGASAAVDAVISKLPTGFPEKIAASIDAGIAKRLRMLENWEAEAPASVAKGS